MKVAHCRLAYSRQMCVVAYLRESQEMLAVRCTELAQQAHPTQSDRSLAECFAEEQAARRPVTACFDGDVEQIMRACLVRVDRNRYSVPAALAGKVVSVRLTAQWVRVVAQAETMAGHDRRALPEPIP